MNSFVRGALGRCRKASAVALAALAASSPALAQGPVVPPPLLPVGQIEVEPAAGPAVVPAVPWPYADAAPPTGGMPALAQPVRTNDAYMLELLRRTLDEQKKNPGKVIRAATNQPPASVSAAPVAPTTPPAMAELERQYLAGKITSKQYQKALERAQKSAPVKAVSAPAIALTEDDKPVPTRAISPKAAAASGVKIVAPEPAIPTPPPVPNPNLKKLSDVDLKIEELMQRNRDREKAAAAAALPTSNPDGTPLSKRQRLNLLLRQVVEGKLTDVEYKAAREKIAAEPD